MFSNNAHLRNMVEAPPLHSFAHGAHSTEPHVVPKELKSEDPCWDLRSGLSNVSSGSGVYCVQASLESTNDHHYYS